MTPPGTVAPVANIHGQTDGSPRRNTLSSARSEADGHAIEADLS
jgi:hypothetical protein